jgi:hypothetical protein
LLAEAITLADLLKLLPLLPTHLVLPPRLAALVALGEGGRDVQPPLILGRARLVLSHSGEDLGAGQVRPRSLDLEVEPAFAHSGPDGG